MFDMREKKSFETKSGLHNWSTIQLHKSKGRDSARELIKPDIDQ